MDTEYDRVDVRGVVGFVLVAYLPAWLLTLPMWLTGQGLSWAWSPVVLVAMMFMPAVATFVTNRWISPRRRMLRETGITNRGGIAAWWRYALLGWFAPPLVMMLALVVGYALGVYQADWGDFSGLSDRLRFSPTDQQGMQASTALPLLAVQTFLLGWLNVISAFGEEWGWRGYLTRALLPLGQPGAFLVTGVLWGLWHAPLLVLGYNYPTAPVVVAFIMMICFCTLTGTLLGWLRLASRSVWPAVIGHGFLNASATLPMVFSAADQPVPNVSVGLLGWSGWIVLVLLILVLIALHKLPVPNPVPREPGLTKGRLSRPRT
ncbi:CPBP family intramembrane glutamic endopeptidase [Haloactinomyces albus]|uniref:Membrane protease YdiL (CAAX protease family) n=1 Tax=Haloactinomyces albus TaxID=1352928 RepID=A0AAE3ZDC3_9ACTN|nr:CPBP family intramembrane glutamic endopeptidase [Haloactinomyces albus]MDR7301177.1 membrane protease YdiL (CAAX protease family) [Haloactinomyces albus]